MLENPTFLHRLHPAHRTRTALEQPAPFHPNAACLLHGSRGCGNAPGGTSHSNVPCHPSLWCTWSVDSRCNRIACSKFRRYKVKGRPSWLAAPQLSVARRLPAATAYKPRQPGQDRPYSRAMLPSPAPAAAVPFRRPAWRCRCLPQLRPPPAPGLPAAVRSSPAGKAGSRRQDLRKAKKAAGCSPHPPRLGWGEALGRACGIKPGQTNQRRSSIGRSHWQAAFVHGRHNRSCKP